ncbi:MAG: porin [Pirellulales bacterium]
MQPGDTSPLTLEQRVQWLEQELQRQRDAAAAHLPTPPPQPPPLQFGGQLQADAILIGQDAANRASVGDAQNVADFRRARIAGRGQAFDVFEYVLAVDFALPGRPSFLDVWGGIHDLPVLGQLRVGHFFEPFSLERTTHNGRTTFMERSLAVSLAPGRNLGIEAYDALGDDQRASYQVGVFASDGNFYGEQFADVGGVAGTGRLTWLPWWSDDERGFWHVGGAYSLRAPADQRLIFFAYPEARAGTPSPANIPPFVNTGLLSADMNQLFGVETALVYGPLYVQSELTATSVNQIGGPDLFFHGAYVNVSYFLTGEHRTYNKLFGIVDRVHPHENFFRVRTEDGPICTGKGAWEVAARYSYLDLTDANIEGGVQRNVTCGVTWHLTALMRIKWEVIQANLDRAPVGTSQATIAGMRFDFEF